MYNTVRTCKVEVEKEEKLRIFVIPENFEEVKRLLIK